MAETAVAVIAYHKYFVSWYGVVNVATPIIEYIERNAKRGAKKDKVGA